MTEKEVEALHVVNKYSMYSAGAGLVPIPLVDVAAIAGVQLKMLTVLAKHYDIPFAKDRAKALVTSLVGGVLPTTLGYGILGSLVRHIPLVGQAVSVFTVSACASASTYAVGKVFIQHFESGGTFLDFDPDKVRAYFSQMSAKAREA